MAKKRKAAKPAAKKSPKKKGAKAAKKSTAKKPAAKKSPKKKASNAKKPAARSRRPSRPRRRPRRAPGVEPRQSLNSARAMGRLNRATGW